MEFVRNVLLVDEVGGYTSGPESVQNLVEGQRLLKTGSPTKSEEVHRPARSAEYTPPRQQLCKLSLKLFTKVIQVL